MPKVQIVIPAINYWDKFTKDCIASIKTKYEYRILLIDNASDDNTREEASKLVSSTFAHQRNEEVWSVSKSWNFGVKDAFERGYDYVLVLNNDVILHPEAIDRMIERFETEKTGQATSLLKLDGSGDTTIISTKDLAMVTCMDIRGECATPQTILHKDTAEKKDCPESEHPCFSGFMINKKCWENVGEFDEGFAPAYYEDNDYHYRINLSGMKAIVLPMALFYHYGSNSVTVEIKGVKVITNQLFEKNRSYFVAKWGDLPGQEKYQRPFNSERLTIKKVKQN